MRILLLLIVIIITSSCNSSKNDRIKTPKEIFDEAIEEYEDKDYIKARQLLDVVKLQYPASEYAEYSQYYIGECEFQEKDYILAAFSYNSVRRIYPNSKYSKISMYKAALCYYELSPSFERDQEYTKKAIRSFQEFQYNYPNDSLSIEANNRINELRTKLAKKQYNTAILYRKLSSPKSALIYYDEVIANYDDTEFYEDAYYGKTETMVSLRRYDEALGLISLYRTLFPSGKYLDKIEKLNVMALERRSNLDELRK